MYGDQSGEFVCESWALMTFGPERASYLIALPPSLPFYLFYGFVLDLQRDCRCYWEARYRCGPVRCTACGTSARKDERSVWGCAAYGYLLLRYSYPPDASRGNDLCYTFFTSRLSLLFVFTAWWALWLYWRKDKSIKTMRRLLLYGWIHERTFWLASPAGKMGPSCPFGNSRVGPARPQEKILFFAI